MKKNPGRRERRRSMIFKSAARRFKAVGWWLKPRHMQGGETDGY